MDALVLLIPFLPLCAALIIGVAASSGLLDEKASAHLNADIAIGATGLSCLMALALSVGDWLGKTSGYFSVGQWLGSDTLDIRINFISSGFPVWLAAVFALLLWLVGWQASHDPQRGAGGQRFFFILCLFAAAIQTLVLSANMIGTLAGWQISGWCAYLLVGYAYGTPAATGNACRVFIAQQIGTIGLLIGISLCYIWLDNVNWARLALATEDLGIGQATGVSLCFTWAAFALSAQLPFTPWLARAMPTAMPASPVIMSHAGIYLLWQLHPVFEQSPFARAVLGIVGVLTALYCSIIGLTQTDYKNGLAYATAGQLGLMFLEAALGWWQIMAGHCCLHVLLRCLQCLRADDKAQRTAAPQIPALPIPSVIAGIGNRYWAFTSSLQGFWLEPIIDWALVNPVRKMAQDLCYFDSQIIDRLMGSPEPAIRTLATFAQHDETFSETSYSGTPNGFALGNGLAGKLAQWAATLMHGFEDRFVTRGLGSGSIHWLRKMGYAANRFELVIIRPRYLVLFVGITFLVAF